MLGCDSGEEAGGAGEGLAMMGIGLIHHHITAQVGCRPRDIRERLTQSAS